MRDEDLKNLPQSIERWKFAEMLEALGLGRDAQNNLRGFVVNADEIKAVVYASDEHGRRYAVREMDQVEAADPSEAEPSWIRGGFTSEAATHEISIPLVGSWKRPDGLEADGISRCQSRPVGEYSALQCERGPSHSGQHVAWNNSGSDVRWGSNSGEPANFGAQYRKRSAEPAPGTPWLSSAPERCEEESVNGLMCQEVWAHDGEHCNGETFWR